MALQNPFKLEKFLIEAFEDEERKKPAGSFEAMFNPETFSQTYEQYNSPLQGLITSGRANKFILSSPSVLKVTLILDDTRVSSYGAASLAASTDVASNLSIDALNTALNNAIDEAGTSLSDRLDNLLKLIHDFDGDLHQSHFLKVTWGNRLTGFECVLQGIDIKYPLFGRNGDPLRAEVALILIEDMAALKRLAKSNLRSPDLSRFLTVKSSDTLPHIANKAYSESTFYIQLAQSNGYTNFRRLPVASTIQTPPVEN